MPMFWKRRCKRPRLSLVVASYNMQRELPRVAFSLMPPYQRGLGAGDIELIVVDNGSAVAPQATDLPDGARLLVVDNPTPSPARAINIGLREARAELIGVLIDGARLASPGLCRLALLAHGLSERPVIATMGFHLGPDVQMKSVPEGYCQEQEDRLLESIDWRNDGYRLFEIAVFAGSSANGWFRPMAESNALFMPHALWDELGGYSEAFASLGGGFVNLDTFVRACELPGSELITLLGEGTFHQVHGGIATNQKHPQANPAVFHQEYTRIRGKQFVMPEKKTLLLGTVPPQARQSLKLSVDALLPN
jgi:hypothetical protein